VDHERAIREQLAMFMPLLFDHGSGLIRQEDELALP
jgi:hypothetical protein